MRFLLSLALLSTLTVSCAHYKKSCSKEKCKDKKSCELKKEGKKDCCKKKDQNKDA